jgi:hypothetical protein
MEIIEESEEKRLSKLIDVNFKEFGETFADECLYKACKEGNIMIINLIMHKKHEFIKKCMINMIFHCYSNIQNNSSDYYVYTIYYVFKYCPKYIIYEYLDILAYNRNIAMLINFFVSSHGFHIKNAIKIIDRTEDEFIENYPSTMAVGISHNKIVKDILKYSQMIEKCPDISKYNLTTVKPIVKMFVEYKCNYELNPVIV